MKKLNKVLAFLLAIALIFTTFGSDFATAHVYAEEETPDLFEVIEGDVIPNDGGSESSEDGGSLYSSEDASVDETPLLASSEASSEDESDSDASDLASSGDSIIDDDAGELASGDIIPEEEDYIVKINVVGIYYEGDTYKETVDPLHVYSYEYYGTVSKSELLATAKEENDKDDTRKDYEAAGVYYDEALSDEALEDIFACEVSYTLYVKFTKEAEPEPETFELIFDANAPEGTTATGSTDNVTATPGVGAEIPKCGYKVEGYDFVCWSLLKPNPNLTDPNELKTVTLKWPGQTYTRAWKPASGSLTFYALWKKTPEEATLHYYILMDDQAMPTSSVPDTKAKYYPAGEDWEGKAKALSKVANDEHGNYWNPDINGTGVKDAIISIPSESITSWLQSTYDDSITVDDVLWHVYKDDPSDGLHIDGYPTGRVTYYLNDGTGGSLADPKMRLNESYTIKTLNEAFGIESRDGFVFKGWNTKEDGTGENWDEGYNFPLRQNLKLYAQWQPIGDIVIHVRVGADGKGGRTAVPYNSLEQQGDLGVKVYVKEASGQQSASAADVLKNALTDTAAFVRSMGTIVAHAAEGKNIDGLDCLKVDAATVNVTVNGVNMDVTVDELYVGGGSGTDVGVYPIMLYTGDMKAETIIGGKKVDVSNYVTLVFDFEGNLSDVTEWKVPKPSDKWKMIGELDVLHSPVYVAADSFTINEGDSVPPLTAVTGFDDTVMAEKYPGVDFTATIKDALVAEAKGEVAGKTKVDYTLYVSGNQIIPTGLATQGNFIIRYLPGTLTIRPNTPDDPPSPPDDPTPTPPTPVRGQVLGAQRPVATDEPAVLGARRSGTGDTTNTVGRILTIIVAAGIGFTMVFIKRKKEEEK